MLTIISPEYLVILKTWDMFQLASKVTNTELVALLLDK